MRHLMLLFNGNVHRAQGTKPGLMKKLLIINEVLEVFAKPARTNKKKHFEVERASQSIPQVETPQKNTTEKTNACIL